MVCSLSLVLTRKDGGPTELTTPLLKRLPKQASTVLRG